MHRVVQVEVENVLANSDGMSRVHGAASNARLQALTHLEECASCRAELSLMQLQSVTLRQLRVPEEIEPRPGFYARVLERIEAEGPASIWNLFMESAFGRRIAVASLALAVLLSVYLISSERTADDPMIAGDPSSQSVAPTQQAEGAAENSRARMAVGREFPAEDFVQVSPSQFGQFPDRQFGMGQSPINQISMEQSSDDAVLSNLMTYREQ